jgi:pyruvate/2-oxoglutarate/acetoin dehydrogenase E1 component
MEKEDFQKQLDEQQKALAMIYKSVEKTRKMILWSGVVTAVTFIIPLIIAVAMLPKMIDTLTGDINKINGNEPIQLNAESLSDTLNNLKDLGL